MARFRVIWEYDNGDEYDDIQTPMDAALDALAIQRNWQSIATVFTVIDKETGKQYTVDLTDDICQEDDLM